jgi:glycosyltransferase involved in cell wall biosynthesis
MVKKKRLCCDGSTALTGVCLASVLAVARTPELQGERVLVVVVADSCSDDTARIAEAAGAIAIAVNCRNVGQARAAGAVRALDAGALWLVFTDAGTVAVEDWHDHGERMRSHHARNYEDRDGHRHIHGANLGVCAHAYQSAGGFPPLQSSEDVALVNALIASGAHVAWSAAPRVVISAR